MPPSHEDGPGLPRSRPPGARSALLAFSRAAFPLALLLVGTFFLGGRIGFWSDDYWHNLRNSVTGALPPLTLRGLTMERPFFLRPLFYAVVPAVTTLSWKSQWPAHLLLTACHGIVTALLWRLLRTLRISPGASAGAALLFMVYPAHFEAVFWTAALPTSIATACMLRLMIVYARYARREPPFTGGRGWWAVRAMPALVFEACCLNEQPAMGVLVLPLVYWAARAGGASPGARGREWLRALGPALACGGAVLLYAACVLLDPRKPAGARGSAEQFVALAQLPERTLSFVRSAAGGLTLRDFAPGALRLGWDTLRGSPLLAGASAAVLAGTGVLWLRARPRHNDVPGTARPCTRAALLGFALFTTAWLPILIMADYEPDSRTRYWPAIGLALLAAAAFQAVGRMIPHRPVRAVGTGALLCILALGATTQIGIQSAFRARWRLDHAQATELRALVPNPVPYTFFLPLAIESTGLRTGSPAFDSHFRSVWEYPWTTPKFIESAYGRDDLRAGYWRHWTPGRPAAGASEAGILYTDPLGPRFPREVGGWRIPWERCIPFVIDADSHIHLVTTIRTPRAVYPLPQAAGAPPLELTLPSR